MFKHSLPQGIGVAQVCSDKGNAQFAHLGDVALIADNGNDVAGLDWRPALGR